MAVRKFTPFTISTITGTGVKIIDIGNERTIRIKSEKGQFDISVAMDGTLTVRTTSNQMLVMPEASNGVNIIEKR